MFFLAKVQASKNIHSITYVSLVFQQFNYKWRSIWSVPGLYEAYEKEETKYELYKSAVYIYNEQDAINWAKDTGGSWNMTGFEGCQIMFDFNVLNFISDIEM